MNKAKLNRGVAFLNSNASSLAYVYASYSTAKADAESRFRNYFLDLVDVLDPFEPLEEEL